MGGRHGRRDAMLPIIWPRGPLMRLLKRWPLRPFSSALTRPRLAVLRSGTSIALQSVNLAGFTTLLKPLQFAAMKQELYPSPSIFLLPFTSLCCLIPTLLYSPTSFSVPISIMPVVRFAQDTDDTFHHTQDVGEKRTSRKYNSNDTRGAPKGKLNFRWIYNVTVG